MIGAVDAQPENVPLLTGYDAKRCQRRIHNDHDPTLDKVAWEVPADLQQRFDQGLAFEAEVFQLVKGALDQSRWRDLSEIRGKQPLIEATVDAMSAGVEMILGGWLPDDRAGGRTGRPDVLLHVGDGYVPGDVKWHKTARESKRGTLRYSVLAQPGRVQQVDGLSAITTGRIDDYLQLSHYWRMLEAVGKAADGEARGFIIGTDRLVDLDPSGVTLTWLDLDSSMFRTFSRSQGTKMRTALERYDFEHGIRLDIARVAQRRSGAPDDPDPLVKPIFSAECDACPWYDYCRELAGDAASAHVRVGRLDVREWRALDSLGVVSLDEVADLDVDDPHFQARYLPEVAHRGGQALSRLRLAVRRARMHRAGMVIEQETTGPVPVPRADVEIDFDIEDAEDRVYLWGALVRDGDSEPFFAPTVSWDELDADAERALAQSFVDWLRGIRDRAAAERRSVLAYHYTSYEVQALQRILGAEEVADIADLLVDLHAIVGAHYFGADGLGPKKVAPAFGFHWRDEEPSGLLSQLWYLDAVQGDDVELANAARKRLLDYNEDDVRATLAVREGIAAHAQ